MLSRRLVLRGALLTGAFASSATFAPVARAADALKVGILIPGSKSDKGWMESSYDGLMASEKKYGDKIKVQMIENINYADMDQALTNLASKNDLVIGVGGQTQASVYKIAKRFPKVHFSIVGGNEGESAPNVAGYDVKQAEIAYVAGAAAAMLSKTGAIILCRRSRNSLDRQRRQGIRQRRQIDQSQHQILSKITPAISTTSPRPRKRRWRRSRRAPTSTITS